MMRKKPISTIILISNTVLIWALIRNCSADSLRWSDNSLKEQAAKLKCCPTNLYKSTVPKLRNNAANYTDLGKVADIEVCVLLCCELEDCHIAWMENEICRSVHCKNDCQSEKATNSQSHSLVVEMRRDCQDKSESKGHSQKDVTGEKYDENKSTIVTKQAATSNATIVQKSSMPVQIRNHATNNGEQTSLVITSNQSPMELLLQKESNRIHSQAMAFNADHMKGRVANIDKGKETVVRNNIQPLNEHLKKVDEKSEITALEENDTKAALPKHKYYRRHDLRHSLISPIIIGAFTCMAVIAVSGFAMAIIKYQKERHEKLATQSTQTLESN